MANPMSAAQARIVPAFGLVALVAACAADPARSPAGAPPSAAAVERDGPFAPANTTITLDDTGRDRSLTVELWYPADPSQLAAARRGEPVAAMLGGPARTTYEALLAAAPADGPTRRTHAVRGADPVAAPSRLPLVVFSHCMNCLRFDTLSVSERLASHGFVVAAPDHAGGTLIDSLAGQAASLDGEFLDVRAADVRFVLDALLAGSAAVPAALRGRFDADRVGLYGHSFGGATVGRVLMLDDRPRAGLALAVPMASPLLPAVDLAAIDVPIMLLMAVEDNMIYRIGNHYIEENFAAADVPVWMTAVTDAGHMSFTDMCRITSSYHAGCGRGERQEGGAPFRYIEQDLGIAIAQAYVTAFFAAQLNGDPDAAAYLTSGRPAEWVTTRSRNTD